MVKITPPSPVAAAVLGGCALAWFAIAFVPAPVTSADWAAWVQGLGTIIAVALATWTRPAAVAPAPERGARRADAHAERLDAVVSWLRRASTDLDLAILDADFRRLREGVAQIRDGQARSTLEQMLREPPSAWPDVGLRGRAIELQNAVVALGELLPEPDADGGGELSGWWVALQAAVTQLRTATEDLRVAAVDAKEA